MKYNLDDTIAAVLTAVSNSGVSIIRISGSKATQIINEIFTNKIEDHRVSYGKIKDNEVTIDEVLVTYMQAPKSYTCEDVVEVNCHGGVITTKKILNLILKKGARLAEAGEFTKRAFLNGRIDLSEAESVMSIINSKSEKEQEISINQLQGSLSTEIKAYRNKIITLLAQIEASIDYPEHDMEHNNLQEVEIEIMDLYTNINKLLNTSDTGKIIKEGIETAIIGRPNVGKSSFLNKLAGDDIAIVTDIAGTTRDTVSEYINVKGVILKLIDTAGIRDTTDVVEKIGVDKAMEVSQKAELIIYMLDGSDKLSENDIEILQGLINKKIICVINKSDLGQNIDIPQISQYVPRENIIITSIKENTGIDDFYGLIDNLFLKGVLENENNNLIINQRHQTALTKTVKSIDKILEGIALGMSEDLIAIDLKDAYEFLGEILGESIEEDIIDKIFANFCLGK